jgi:hypothetical protein
MPVTIVHVFECADKTCSGLKEHEYPYVDGSGTNIPVLPVGWQKVPDGRIFCDLHKITITIEDQ